MIKYLELSGGPLPVGAPVTRRSSHPIVTPLSCDTWSQTIIWCAQIVLRSNEHAQISSLNFTERSQCFKHDDSAINIVEVLLLLLLLVVVVVVVVVVVL